MSARAQKETQSSNHALDDAPKELHRRADWHGIESLSDHELLALVLSEPEIQVKDELAQQGLRLLIQNYGNLALLQHLRPHSLRDQFSLCPAHAYRLAAAFQLGQRAHRDALIPPPNRPLNYEMIVHWARPRLAGLEHEEVWVLCVNSHTALRSAWQVGKGGIHGCGLLARDILVPVVRDGASGFILVHNHPSGDPTPSSEDIDLTRGIQIAAMSLCIPLLDHVVVARGGARSFFELGYLDR